MELLAKIAIGVSIPVMVIVGLAVGLPMYDDIVLKMEQQERKMEQKEVKEQQAVAKNIDKLRDISKVCNYVVRQIQSNGGTEDDQLDFLWKCPENLTDYGYPDINDSSWCRLVNYCPAAADLIEKYG